MVSFIIISSSSSSIGSSSSCSSNSSIDLINAIFFEDQEKFFKFSF